LQIIIPSNEIDKTEQNEVGGIEDSARRCSVFTGLSVSSMDLRQTKADPPPVALHRAF